MKASFKRFVSLLLVLVMVFALIACGQDKGLVLNGVDFGELEYEGISILGVTYDFYDNGYAFIKAILHENAQIADTVTYEDKDYSVAAIGYIAKGTFDRSLGNSIFDNAYAGIESPENLMLPDSIIFISSNALAFSTALSITLPKNITHLGSSVFRGCRNIKTVDFPDALTSITGYSLFSSCDSLEYVTFPEDIKITDLSGCFTDCYSLKSVIIPGSVETLGSYPFSNCYELAEVIIGEGITTFPSLTFSSCHKLQKFVFPESVTLIEDMVFHDCPQLEDVTLPDGITDVPAKLFTNEYHQAADVSNLTIRVRKDLVDYVQSIYPEANVVAK